MHARFSFPLLLLLLRTASGGHTERLVTEAAVKTEISRSRSEDERNVLLNTETASRSSPEKW